MLEISEITPHSSPISHLDLAPSEERIIQSHGCLDRVLVCELHVGETLGATVELVAKDSHPLNGAATGRVARCKRIIRPGDIENFSLTGYYSWLLHLTFYGIGV